MSPAAYKILDNVDIKVLQDYLINHPEIFGKYDYRTVLDTSPHRDSTDIWVRYGDFDKHGLKIIPNEHDSVWFPVLLEIPTVAQIAFHLMLAVHGERLGGILITKVPPGGKIYRHTDYGWHAAYYDKYYVPVLNKKGATFSFEDGTVIDGEEGSAYWFRNDIDHWVDNDTDSDRIAMIVCIKPFRGVDKE